MALFEKGHSGNPAGRPVGIRDRRVALRAALEGRANDLLDKAVERALEGDSAVLLALLSKLIPNLKSESGSVETLIQGSMPSEQAKNLVSATMSGELSPSVALDLMGVLAGSLRIQETEEIFQRLERLEAMTLGNL